MKLRHRPGFNTDEEFSNFEGAFDVLIAEGATATKDDVDRPPHALIGRPGSGSPDGRAYSITSSAMTRCGSAPRDIAPLGVAANRTARLITASPKTGSGVAKLQQVLAKVKLVVSSLKKNDKNQARDFPIVPALTNRAGMGHTANRSRIRGIPRDGRGMRDDMRT